MWSRKLDRLVDRLVPVQVAHHLLSRGDALRVLDPYERHVPEVVVGTQCPGLLVGGREHLLEPDLDMAPVACRGHLHRLDLGAGCGRWLLDPDMASGVQRVDRQPRVARPPAVVVRRYDEHRIEVLGGEHLGVVRIGPLGAEPVREHFRASAVEVARGDEIDGNEMQRRVDVAERVRTAADHAGAHHSSVDRPAVEVEPRSRAWPEPASTAAVVTSDPVCRPARMPRRAATPRAGRWSRSRASTAPRRAA